MTYSNEYYKKIMKPYREKHIDHIKELEQKRKAKIKKALITFLGGKCVLCNRKSNQTSLIIHEIHGKSHPNPLTQEGISYIITHKEDFVLLCRPNHATIHRLKNEGKLEIMIVLCKQLLFNP